MECKKCQSGRQLGPGQDNQCPKHTHPEITEALSRIAKEDVEHQKCPPEHCIKCGEQTFDGWKCSSCGFEISEKAKTAHGRKLSPEEAAKIKKELGIE